MKAAEKIDKGEARKGLEGRRERGLKLEMRAPERTCVWGIKGSARRCAYRCAGVRMWVRAVVCTSAMFSRLRVNDITLVVFSLQ